MRQPKNIGRGLFIAFLMAASPSVAATEDSASVPAESEVQEEREPVRVLHQGMHHSNSGQIRLTAPGEHAPAASDGTSDKGPVQLLNPANFIVPPNDDPFSFLSDATNFIRSKIGKPLGFSFEPQMIYIFQHATKSNGNNSFSYIYTNINGAFPVHDYEDSKGHLVYNIQGNSSIGTPNEPFINDALGSPFFIDNVLTSGRLSLKKLWWRQSFMDDTFTINVGKLYYDNFFDLNVAAENPANQFVAAQLTNNTTVPYPTYGFGAVGEYDFTDELGIRFGTMNALSTGRATGFENIEEGKLFSVVQTKWSPTFTDGTDYFRGNYRVFGWYSNNDVDYERGGWGMGVSFDQEIGGGVVPFFRWGVAQDGAAPATMCWSTGTVLNGFLGRKHDGIGIGCTFSNLADSGIATGDNWETLVEVFWRIQVTRTLQVSPDLQWFNSGESGGVENTWIWGLRCTWNF
ncbi:MAG: hypothetical protein CMJ24_11285 [Phycisphaerae bacterium]|nr:hypothetical protein [Phycisphaerae bacterium]